MVDRTTGSSDTIKAVVAMTVERYAVCDGCCAVSQKYKFGNQDANVLVIAEAGCFIAAAILAALWYYDPNGSYEPGFTVVTVMGAGIELLRRHCFKSDCSAKRKPTQHREVAALLGAIDSLPLSVLLPQALEMVRGTTNTAFEKWIRLELYGYDLAGGMKAEDVVPEYREVGGQHRDAHGRPVSFVSQLGFLNTHRFRFGVKQLEELAAAPDGITIRDSGAAELIRSHLNREVSGFEIHASEVVSVLDRIRNIFREKLSRHLSVEEAKTAI